MRKIILIVLLTSFAVASNPNVIMSWCKTKKNWFTTWVYKGGKKFVVCWNFYGGNCLEKEDVSDRVYTVQTSSGMMYVIREK